MSSSHHLWWAQLGACLEKNALLKWRDKVQTAAEIALPPLFVLLLVWIKSLASKYDSPNVSYVCGQAFPFQYEASIEPGRNPTLLSCLVQEPQCSSQYEYFRDPYNISGLTGLPNLTTEYGWMSPIADLAYPFYSLTVGDESRIYDEARSLLQLPVINPSLPLSAIARRLRFSGQECFIAVTSSTVDDGAVEAASAFSIALGESLTREDPTLDGVVRAFPSEGEMLSYIDGENYDDGSPKVGFAIVFNSSPIGKGKTNKSVWDYTLRFNFTYGVDLLSESATCLYDGGGSSCFSPLSMASTGLPSTNFVTRPLLRPPSSSSLAGYAESGFLTVQREVESWILSVESGKNITLNVSLGLFPEAEFHTDEFYEVTRGLLGILYVIAFLYPVNRMIRLWVSEKESRQKELLCIMGCSPLAFYVSHFITMVVQLMLSAAFLVAASRSSIFLHSSGSLVLLYFFVVSLALVSFSFLVSTFFSSAKMAATLGSVIYFGTFLPYYYVGGASSVSTLPTKLWSSLLAPCAIALSGDMFAVYEGGQVGVHLGNVFESYEEGLSYFAAVGMLLLDAVFYVLVACYTSHVLPTQLGTPLPWYFPLRYMRQQATRLYSVATACFGSVELGRAESELTAELLGACEGDLVERAGAEFERREDTAAVLHGLQKVYPDGTNAVKGISLTFYQDQISVLLGANGAGKSSLISMLTGLIPATGGDASIRGHMLSTNTDKIRSFTGFCPQHDIQYQDLTVMEHLKLYSVIKGIPWSKRTAVAAEMAQEVGLGPKMNSKVSSLSGGMKRKLSVALTLCGDSKFCILDEPSTGLDERSRLELWAILQKRRRGRIMLLTTHYMDEADHLGDLIAIMSDGNLECAGSSLYLKELYSVGNTLTICDPTDSPSHEIVAKHFPSAAIFSSSGSEVKYRLPFECGPLLAPLFRELEALDQVTFGIDTTSLEEVFLRADGRHLGPARKILISPEDSPMQEQQQQAQQQKTKIIGILLRKRAICASRDFKGLLYQILIPTLLQLGGFIMLRLSRSAFMQPSLALDPSSMYDTWLVNATNAVPLPIQVVSPASDFSQEIVSRIPGSIPVSDVSVEDQFAGCARGAPELVHMSSILLSNSLHSSHRDGVNNYGAVTIASSTMEADGSIDVTYNLLVNASAVHAAPSFMNLVHSAAAAAVAEATADGSPPTIILHSHPLPQTQVEKSGVAAFDSVTVAIMIVTSFCFIPASYATFVVREREGKLKYLQFLAGAGPFTYWFSTILWDVSSFLIPWAIGLVLLNLFRVSKFIHGASGLAVSLLLLAYGPAAAAFTYAISFLFKSHSSAFSGMLILNFITGLALMLTSFVMSLLDSTWKINRDLKGLYRLFPGFCLGDGLLQLSLCVDDSCPVRKANSFDASRHESPFAWEVAGADIFFLFIGCILYFSITIIVELFTTIPRLRATWHRAYRRLRFLTPSRITALVADLQRHQVTDEDVAEEEERVLKSESNSSSASSYAVVMRRLRKVYYSAPPKLAVNDLSLAVPRGSCFGLLGPNGAGKSSVQGILSGSLDATAGECHIDGQDILRQWSVPQGLGYCPQSESLSELLTVSEHIRLFAALKGIDAADSSRALLKEMRIEQFESTQARFLSGGSRRKLAFLLAAMGQPAFILLDEPSAGMDPVSRRIFWDALERARSHSTVILTSHSMEEVESTCSRIGIMINGRIVCLGPIQHVKSKFGRSLEVRVTLHDPSENSLKEAGILLGDASSYLDLGNTHVLDELCSALDEKVPLGMGWMGAFRSTGAFLLRSGHNLVPLEELRAWIAAEMTMANFAESLAQVFPGTLLSERGSLLRAKFILPKQQQALFSRVFDFLEHSKRNHSVDTYSVGQQSLQSIFNALAGNCE